MLAREDAVRLRHMLDHAREAVVLVEGKGQSDLVRSRLLQLALVRLIEVVGEAATRVSPTAREVMPDVPWVQIVGMRNRLIHGYDSIDLAILWRNDGGRTPGLGGH